VDEAASLWLQSTITLTSSFDTDDRNFLKTFIFQIASKKES
jgi:hypothetical protein